MAAAFDNFVELGGTNLTTITTGTFTIAGANRAAMVHLEFDTLTQTSITASVGGASCAAIAGTDSASTSGVGRTMCRGGVAPATGSQTATASWTTSAPNVVLAAITATGVDQTTPFAGGQTTFITSAATITLTMVAASGDLTCTMEMDLLGTSPTTNRTRKWTEIFMGAGDVGPGNLVNPAHTWTPNSTPTSDAVMSGAVFKQVAAGGAASKCIDNFRIMGCV